MTDIVKIAKERRAALASEIAKLEDFIRMAEALARWSEASSNRLAGDDEKAA